jgi:hypothetical protein
MYKPMQGSEVNEMLQTTEFRRHVFVSENINYSDNDSVLRNIVDGTNSLKTAFIAYVAIMSTKFNFKIDNTSDIKVQLPLKMQEGLQKKLNPELLNNQTTDIAQFEKFQNSFYKIFETFYGNVVRNYQKRDVTLKPFGYLSEDETKIAHALADTTMLYMKIIMEHDVSDVSFWNIEHLKDKPIQKVQFDIECGTNYSKLHNQILRNLELYHALNPGITDRTKTFPILGDRLINLYKHPEHYIVPHYYLLLDTSDGVVEAPYHISDPDYKGDSKLIKELQPIFDGMSNDPTKLSEAVLKSIVNYFKKNAPVYIFDENDFEFRFVKALSALKQDKLIGALPEFSEINTFEAINKASNLVAQGADALVSTTLSNLKILKDKPHLKAMFPKDLLAAALLLSQTCNIIDRGLSVDRSRWNKWFDQNMSVADMIDKITTSYEVLTSKRDIIVKSFQGISKAVEGKFSEDPNLKNAAELTKIVNGTYDIFSEKMKDPQSPFRASIKKYVSETIQSQQLTPYIPVFCIAGKESPIMKEVATYFASFQEGAGVGDFMKGISKQIGDKVKSAANYAAEGMKRLDRGDDDTVNPPEALAFWIGTKDDDLLRSFARVEKHNTKHQPLGDIQTDMHDAFKNVLKNDEDVYEFFGNEDNIAKPQALKALKNVKSAANSLGGAALRNKLAQPRVKYLIEEKKKREHLLPGQQQQQQKQGFSLFGSPQPAQQQQSALSGDEAAKIFQDTLKNMETQGPTQADLKATQDIQQKSIEQAKELASAMNKMDKVSVNIPPMSIPEVKPCTTGAPFASWIPKKTFQNKAKDMKKQLSKLETFVKFMVDKNTKWITDANALCAEIKKGIDNAKATLTKPDETRSTKQAALNRMYLLYRKMLNMYTDKLSINLEYNKQFFLKTHRKSYASIIKYIQENAVMKNDKFWEAYKMEPAKKEEIKKDYAEIVKLHGDHIKQLVESNTKFYQVLKQSFATCNTLATETMLPKDQKDELEQRSETVINMMNKNLDKLLSFYYINYSTMELIFDSQFFVMYVIKGIRMLFTYIALFLATRVFSPIYEEAVYDQKSNPPPLWKYLLIFFGFDISFNVFLVVLLYLLKFLFKSDDNSFVVDQYLFSKYMTDYAISMVILITAGFVIGNVMMEKKYFKYRYEGLRAIRAYESMMFNIAIVLYIIPYFMMV